MGVVVVHSAHVVVGVVMVLIIVCRIADDYVEHP